MQLAREICHKEQRYLFQISLSFKVETWLFLQPAISSNAKGEGGREGVSCLESVIYFDRSNNVCNQISMTKSTGTTKTTKSPLLSKTCNKLQQQQQQQRHKVDYANCALWQLKMKKLYAAWDWGQGGGLGGFTRVDT